MEPITFEYDGKDYSLTFNRETVKRMEAAGFRLNELGDMPATRIPDLFYGAFQAKHSGIKRKLVDEIYGKMKDKQGLLGKLGELYAAPIESLMADPEADEKNAIVWTANF